MAEMRQRNCDVRLGAADTYTRSCATLKQQFAIRRVRVSIQSSPKQTERAAHHGVLS